MKPGDSKRLFFFLAGIFLPVCFSMATHLRAGEITVERLSCASNTFRVTITVYTNTGSEIKFSDDNIMSEGGSDRCGADPADQKRRCARFVQKVHFTLLNRWGKRVYDYGSGNERNIYIDWNGRDSEGKELSDGIYYYVAEVTFDVVNPSQRVQTLRGWVHLIR